MRHTISRDPAGVHLLTVPLAVHGAIDRAELSAKGIDVDRVIDFSANQSPVAISSATRAAMDGAVLEAYPDREARDLALAVAARHGLAPRQVVVGNGSTELIRVLAQVALDRGDVALSLGPSFGEYEVATVLARGRFVEHRLSLGKDGFLHDHTSFVEVLERLRPSLCWLCSPNNPTGATLPEGTVDELIPSFPGILFVLDEAYADLLDRPQWTVSTLARGNLVVLRSLTKTWGLAGLRLGYALADEAVAAPLRSAKPPWSVNICAQLAGEAVLGDTAMHEEALRLLRQGRETLMSGLRSTGWNVLSSGAGFFLVEVGDAEWAREGLLRYGCLVRDCSSFGLSEYVRVSPRLPEQNERLLTAFAALAGERGKAGCR